MAYKDNWLRHLFAFATGEGYSDKLARDFWDEDLWGPNKPIRWRWLKLVWVYSVSVLAQVTLPLLVGYTVINLFKAIPFRWWMIGVGGVSAGGLVFAILFAATAYIDQRRKSTFS
jgi:hypothetical protein